MNSSTTKFEISATSTLALHHKGYSWNWHRSHKWGDWKNSPLSSIPLIREGTKVFSMGSCFADNVVRFLSRECGIDASAFGESRFYDPASMLQTSRHLLENPQYAASEYFRTADGQWAHPFRNPRYRAKTEKEINDWTSLIENDARRKLTGANVIVLTLGGTETWRDPNTQKTYITIPFPDVFNVESNKHRMEFHNLSYEETRDAIQSLIDVIQRGCPNADIILTVSPIRMTFTCTDMDVRVATSRSKSVLRAAVDAVLDKKPQRVHYFHSYEIVNYAPSASAFFAEDGIHVTDHAVKRVMHEFSRQFIDNSVLDRTGFFLTEEMLQRGESDMAVNTVDRIDFQLLIVRLLRTFHLEKTALTLYRLWKTRR